MAPSHHDATVATMLLSLFTTFGLLLDRVLKDINPTILAADKTVREEARSAKTTNVVSERDFAKFDRLLREKPNASTLALEAHILFTNNKTSKWVHAKSDVDRASLMEEARKNAPHYWKRYHQRVLKISQERENISSMRSSVKKRRLRGNSSP